MEVLLSAGGALLGLGAEYFRADAARRQQILAELDAEYRSYRESLAGLPAALAANDAAADAAAAALPSGAPAAPPVVPTPPVVVPQPTGVE